MQRPCGRNELGQGKVLKGLCGYRGITMRGLRWARGVGAMLRARGWTALDVRLRLWNFPVVLEAPGSSGKQRCGLVRRIY